MKKLLKCLTSNILLGLVIIVWCIKIMRIACSIKVNYLVGIEHVVFWSLLAYGAFIVLLALKDDIDDFMCRLYHLFK